MSGIFQVSSVAGVAAAGSGGGGGGGNQPTPPSAIYGDASYNTDFGLTSLQIPGTGTNNANNNTFLDSSTNNFAITRFGEATQGPFSPFVYGAGTEPATGYYSGYFDGSGDFLSVPTNTNTNLHQIGDWTYEGWIYWLSMPTTGYQNIFGQGAAGQNSFGLMAAGTAANTWTAPYRFVVNQANVGNRLVGTTTIFAQQWYHFAVVRSSGTITLYVNGRSQGSFSNNTDYAFGNNPFTIGNSSYAYVSNFRFVRSAVYTTNFAVPTAPLTAIANTQLLTCQNTGFIDNSTNAYTISTSGQAQPAYINPWAMTAWSGYFDGTGDYLTFPELNIPSSTSFTIEFWFYWTATPVSYSMFIGDDGGNSSKYIAYNVGAGTLDVQTGASAGTVAYCSFTPALNNWYHLAFVRNINTITIYVNGVAQNMTTPTQSGTFLDTGTINYLGRWGGTTPYAINGILSNFRAVVGTAVYTSNFTPPTAPLTSITNTQLLTCQSSTFVDNSPSARTITVNGDAYTGTLNNPFNNAVNYTTAPTAAWSGYFDGSNDYLAVAANSNISALATADFTIECWAFLNSTATDSCLVSSTVAWTSQNNYNFEVRAGGYYRASVGDNIAVDINPGINSFPLKQWNHCALVRRAGTTTLYLNGRSVGSSTTSVNLTRNPIVTIGAFSLSGSSLSNYWKGYISNFRIVRGTAVYTTNFTPPTSPLTAIPGTVLLTCQSPTFTDASIIRNTITPTNGPVTVIDQPLAYPTAAISQATVGGSLYIDGTGDYLSIPKDAALASPADFTFETWIYPTSFAATGTICGFGVKQDTGYSALNWRITTGGAMQSYWSTNGTSETTISGGTVTLNQWQHVAATRSGTTIRLFINGVQTASGTVSGALYTGSAATGGANSYTIGTYFSSNAPAALFQGYMSGFRYINGTARYTTSFVPPTAPATAVANTSLLLMAANGSIVDVTGKNNIITRGDAKISTAQAKYGSSSMFFDGTGDYLTVPPGPDLYLSPSGATAGNLDFTVEFWFYATSVATNFQVMMLRRANQANRGLAINLETSTVKLYVGTTSAWQVQITSTTGSVTANTWNHVAACRIGTTYSLYLNGALVGSSTPTAFVIGDDTSPLYIGSNAAEGSQFPFTGYIQDFRLTVGESRYAYSFAVPAALFTDYWTVDATTAPTTDVYGSYTTALLPGTGTNLSKNTSVTDGSTNAYVVNTGAGTVTLGTLSPYSENGWSNFFDGSGDYYTVPYSSTTNILSGDFTVECWVNLTLIGTGSRQIGGQWRQSTGFGGWQLGVDTSGFIGVAFGAITEASNVITSSIALAANTWYHVALVRNGSVFTLYINGVNRGTTTSSATRAALTTVPTTFGNWLNSSGAFPASGSADLRGYLSNYRIVKGTAIYTTDFTPPTAPLTAVSGTGLLCFQSPYTVDLSGNNNSFTFTGAPTVTPQNPYPPTSAYSAAVNGGSMFFDGSTYLDLSSGIAIPSTGTFTIEFWLYVTTSTVQVLVSQYATGAGNADRTHFTIDNVSGYKLTFSHGTAGTVTGATVVPLQQWNHCAVTRDGSNTLRIFLNGAVDATSSNYTAAIQQTTTRISGFNNTPAYLISDGYMSGLRITNTAVYTAAFTPPAAPPTATAGTTLLLNFTDNTGPVDATGRTIVYSAGDASVSTAITDPWGNNNGVLYFPGTSDAMMLNSIGSTANNVSPLFAPQGDFTWEAWIYPTAASISHIVTWGYNNASSSYAGVYLAYFANLQPTLQVSSTGSSNIADLRATPLTLNVWQHMAVSRFGANLRWFINGALVNETATTADLWAGTATTPDYGSFTLGQRNSGGPQNFAGYMSNVRFTRNRARYWAPFTPPTAAFPLI